MKHSRSTFWRLDKKLDMYIYIYVLLIDKQINTVIKQISKPILHIFYTFQGVVNSINERGDIEHSISKQKGKNTTHGKSCWNQVLLIAPRHGTLIHIFKPNECVKKS